MIHVEKGSSAHKACQKYRPDADPAFSERTPPWEAYEDIAKAHDVVLDIHLYFAGAMHHFYINSGGTKAVIKVLSSGTDALDEADVRKCKGHFDFLCTVSLETVVEQFCECLATVFLRTGDLDFTNFKALAEPSAVVAAIQAWMSGDQYSALNTEAATHNADAQVLDDAFAKLLDDLSHV